MWETRESVRLFPCLNKTMFIHHKYGENQWGLAKKFAIMCTYCKCLEVVSSTIKYLACVIQSVQKYSSSWELVFWMWRGIIQKVFLGSVGGAWADLFQATAWSWNTGAMKGDVISSKSLDQFCSLFLPVHLPLKSTLAPFNLRPPFVCRKVFLHAEPADSFPSPSYFLSLSPSLFFLLFSSFCCAWACLS